MNTTEPIVAPCEISAPLAPPPPAAITVRKKHPHIYASHASQELIDFVHQNHQHFRRHLSEKLLEAILIATEHGQAGNFGIFDLAEIPALFMFFADDPAVVVAHLGRITRTMLIHATTKAFAAGVESVLKQVRANQTP